MAMNIVPDDAISFHISLNFAQFVQACDQRAVRCCYPVSLGVVPGVRRNYTSLPLRSLELAFARNKSTQVILISYNQRFSPN